VAEAPRAKFRRGGMTPPTGWIFEVEHEGQTHMFQSPMYLGLVDQLRHWYAAKQVDWPGDVEIRARVEHYICQRVPGFCEGGPDTPRFPFLSAASIRDATRLIFTRLYRGEGMLVDQKEADRRARICANCPMNLHGICSSCAGNEFQDIFRWLLVRGKKTAFDSVLDTCGVCGCIAKAKLWVGIEELARLEPHEYPGNCWLSGTACDKSKKE
jgi:hypothetical protein